ncbi:MAG: UvrD-helicase domain-containing protein [Thermodesulfovibrionales bacterium]
MDEQQFYIELNKCIKKIIDSDAPKKLVVAGPGTGKSSLFKKAIEHYGGSKEDYLALTFINNLEDELRKDIGNVAKVFTFHGYCHFLLRKYNDLSYGLKDEFHYYPALVELIKSDWNIVKNGEVPKFIKLMRNMSDDKELYFLPQDELLKKFHGLNTPKEEHP